jgi:hypothetical protein
MTRRVREALQDVVGSVHEFLRKRDQRGVLFRVPGRAGRATLKQRGDYDFLQRAANLALAML